MSDDAQRAVSRILDRDDLLSLAADADHAIDIVRQREDVARRGEDGKSLFELALDRHLGLGCKGHGQSDRAQAWNYAAVLLTFCELVGPPLHCDATPEDLHLRALRELEDERSEFILDRDLAIGVTVRHDAARYFRIVGNYRKALNLAKRPKKYFFGRGAEPYVGHYLYEVGASMIGMGNAGEVMRPFSEWDEYFTTNERGRGFSSRHRFDLIRALALWRTDAPRDQVRDQLGEALEHLQANSLTQTARRQQVRELSVTLLRAEFLADDPDATSQDEAIRLGEEALNLANQIRARWSVVARSTAPLARIAQRIYGDLAQLTERLPGANAARLGLRVALSAKQTGFAVRIRDALAFNDNERIAKILDDIVWLEGSTTDRLTDNPQTREEQLKQLRIELADAVSPMLADTVFPSTIDVAQLVAAIGPRYALDYVELHDTLDNAPHLFRTFIRPGGQMWFERCRGDWPTLDRSVDRNWAAAARAAGDPTKRELATEAHEASGTVEWRELARALLPAELVEHLVTDRDLPIRLLISGHSWLSRVPWAGLKIDNAGTRLVEHAVIAQTPILTCLSGKLPPQIVGKVLIRLVGLNEKGVDVQPEREAWGLGSSTDGLPPHACDLGSPGLPQPLTGHFDQALTSDEQWQFIHVAAHGSGKGFDQVLSIPDEPMSAARALRYRWPGSILMASCHVGLVLNENAAEPLSLVMSLLTGGANCVVAGIAGIDDAGTGQTVHTLVEQVRSGNVALDVALRRAQLAAIGDGMDEDGWALLTAYVR